MGKAPWVRWVFRDFFFDFKTKRLSREERDVYHELLGSMWEFSEDQCSLPDDNKQLAKGLNLSLKKWLKIRENIQDKTAPIFIEKDGKLISKRLQIEADRWKKISKNNSDAKHKYWEQIKKSQQNDINDDTNVIPEKYDPYIIRKENKDKREERRKNTPPLPPSKGEARGFDYFWKIYPKKTGKGAALRAWKNSQDKPGIEELANILENQKKWDQWKRGFIPNPATWLNQKRWLDEEPPRQENAKNGESNGIQQWLKQQESASHEPT